MPLITDNFDNFMHVFRPTMAPAGTIRFPAPVAHPVNFVGPNETAHQMFQRVVNTYCGGDVQLASVEPNLAIIAIVQWVNQDRIHRASIQVIKPDTDLETFFHAGGNPTYRYFRFDLDATAGRIFTHPFPHVHYLMCTTFHVRGKPGTLLTAGVLKTQ
jgi:hypothetical protein